MQGDGAPPGVGNWEIPSILTEGTPGKLPNKKKVIVAQNALRNKMRQYTLRECHGGE